MQAECEAKIREFPEIFQCTYEAVASRNPGILQDARAKLYLLRGEQLALSVLQQQMSSLEAKVEWQRLYVDLRAAKEQEITALITATSKALLDARSPPAPRPAPMVQPVSRSINCTSTKLGGSVYTTCN